jgi:hypothetical protein
MPKHKNLKKNKNDYLRYRAELAHRKIRSFMDQSGRFFVHCSECDKKECQTRKNDLGCMAGIPEKEISEIIGYVNKAVK